MSRPERLPDRVSFARVCVQESLKLIRRRRTWLAVQAVVLLHLAVGALVARAPGPESEFAGVFVTQLVAGTVGVVTARTRSAVGSPVQAYWAKAVALGLVFSLSGVFAVWLTASVTAGVLAPWGMAIDLQSLGEFQKVCAAGLYLAVIAGAGLSIGVLARSTPVALAAVVALLFVLPVVTSLCGPAGVVLGGLLLPNAGMSTFMHQVTAPYEQPQYGLWIMMCWVGAGISATVWVAHRRLQVAPLTSQATLEPVDPPQL